MKTYFCDENAVHKGIEETFDAVMLEIYYKYHITARPRPLQPSPTLSERLAWEYYASLAERISDV